MWDEPWSPKSQRDFENMTNANNEVSELWSAHLAFHCCSLHDLLIILSYYFLHSYMNITTYFRKHYANTRDCYLIPLPLEYPFKY